jgi:hypothetical protein
MRLNILLAALTEKHFRYLLEDQVYKVIHETAETCSRTNISVTV